MTATGSSQQKGTTMSSSTNLLAVQRAYDAWTDGRLDDVLAECADDVQWITPGRSRLSGVSKGKEAADAVLAALRAGGYAVSPRHFLADEERVVALVQATIDGRQHGAVDVWTFRDGRIGKYQHASTDTLLLDGLLGEG
jgi:uncharacterized protein